MGIFDRIVKNAVNRAVGNAVEKGIRQAVAPKIEQATTEAINSAAKQINKAAGVEAKQPSPQSAVDREQLKQASSTLGGLFGGLTDVANEAAKNMKICPSCGEGADKNVKFCPKCGSKLPDMTAAEGAVCPSCGKQNDVGTKFCAECGTKLPSAAAEDAANEAKAAAVMARWDSLLPQYPKWELGGREPVIDQDEWAVRFVVTFDDNYQAKEAVKKYRQVLMLNGFKMAGEYPLEEHLYKKVDGVCYHCDTEHCFDGNDNEPILYFNVDEPSGGYDYVKPEPRKQIELKDLFKF